MDLDYPRRSRDQKAHVVRLTATLDARGEEVEAFEDLAEVVRPRCAECGRVATLDGLCSGHWAARAFAAGELCRHYLDEGCTARVWRHGLCWAHVEARLGRRCAGVEDGRACLLPLDAEGVCPAGHAVALLAR